MPIPFGRFLNNYKLVPSAYHNSPQIDYKIHLIIKYPTYNTIYVIFTYLSIQSIVNPLKYNWHIVLNLNFVLLPNLVVYDLHVMQLNDLPLHTCVC